MRNNRKIIGVVGPSGTDLPNQEKIELMAKQIGGFITLSQHILLTGGKPDRNNPLPVKSAAMIGAQDASVESKPARLISVLRRPEFEVRLEQSPACKHLIIKTDLGDKRNFINGYVADVFVAISGGPGTLSEVAFAHYFGVPVIFIETPGINTQQDLSSAYSNKLPRHDFDKIIKDSHTAFPYFDPSILNQKLNQLLNSADNFIATAPKETVEKAVRVAINRSNTLPENLPIIKKYEKEIMNLTSPELL